MKRQRNKDKMLYKAFAKAIAKKTFLPVDTIETVLSAITEVIREAMQGKQDVLWRNLGLFRVRFLTRGFSVGLKPTPDFKDSLRPFYPIEKSTMEKYSVEFEEEAVLLAKVTGKCPSCKTDLDSKDPPHCPTCGTKPFEAKSEVSDRQRAMVKNFGIQYGKKKDDNGTS